MSNIKNFKTTFAGRELEIEVGRLALQTNASCTVRYGETEVLATVVMNKEESNADYLPFTVEFEEKMYAAGKIKGSRFMKREGKASDEAILAGRLIDRGLRPLFNQKIRHDIQVIITVLSLDDENDPDVVGIIAASCVLAISDIPFNGPIGGIRIGYKNNDFIINPTYEQRKDLDLDLAVSGTKEKILMIEMQGKEISEKILESAFEKSMKEMEPLVEFLKDIQKQIGKEKIKEEDLCPKILNEDEEVIINDVKEFMKPLLDKYLFNIPVGTKRQRKEVLKTLFNETIEYIKSKNPNFDAEKILNSFFEDFIEEEVSLAILDNNKRVDGRGIEDLRPLDAEVSVLPRTHGSAIFRRGETQVLSVVTLGAPGDALEIDSMEETTTKRYMHHYNDAPFSYGEAAPIKSLGRRAIGHGALAEKAIVPLLPSEEEFPYTIRVVSEVMSSNGSSSMASICGSSLSLMDAGVPIKKLAAGIAIGMAKNKAGDWKTFTDLQDMEDGFGGMDFKVGGTRDGITAIQMDTKSDGLTMEMIDDALGKAQRARFKILDVLESVIKEPRKELSKYAPRIESIKIDPDKIKDVIGVGGKVIKDIVEQTGATINIDETGIVFITAKDPNSMHKAKEMINDIVREFNIGDVVNGKVIKIMPFGAIVELSPATDGMIHISEISYKRTNQVEDVLKIGDSVKVKIIGKDQSGKISLSMKALEERPKFNPNDQQSKDRNNYNNRPRRSFFDRNKK